MAIPISPGLYLGVAAVLYGIGLYTVATKRNLIKIVIGIEILVNAAHINLIALSAYRWIIQWTQGVYALLYNSGFTDPVSLTLYGGFLINTLQYNPLFVDPLAHSIVMTSIVLASCVTAVALAFVVALYRHYGTLDVQKMRRLKW
ncbi:MAG: NADH-quinone oxidoreductase subunit K [Candidatus Jordarchaeales archaeon]|nr:NADH-quinone oxidoreductase subunit K [Candidatus Jordarchaeia archaeon]